MSNFHPLEVVGRGSETQLQMGENVKIYESAIPAEFLVLDMPRLGREQAVFWYLSRVTFVLASSLTCLYNASLHSLSSIPPRHGVGHYIYMCDHYAGIITVPDKVVCMITNANFPVFYNAFPHIRSYF